MITPKQVCRLTCTVLASSVALGDEKDAAQAVTHWNQFRGPNGQGVADTARVPVKFGPDTNTLWKTPVGDGQSSPVIWEDRIFLTDCSGKDREKLTTLCLHREQGTILWSKSLETEKRNVRYYSMNGPASPTPAADDRHVYAYFGTYGLLCYDHRGTKVWERRLDPPASLYGASVSPILYGDKVILVLDDDKRRSRLLALDRATGKTVWEQPRRMFRAGWATPMIWSHPDRDELVVLGAKRLTSYDPSNGEELWWAGGFSIETIGVPVTGEGLLFVSDAARGGRGEKKWDAERSWKITLEDFDRNKDDRIQRDEMTDGFRILLRPDMDRNQEGAALPVRPGKEDGWLKHFDKDKDGILGREDWLETFSGFSMDSQPVLMAIRPGAAGNARLQSVAWEIDSGIPEIPSPLYHRGKIYLLRNGGVLTCVRASDGEQLFREQLGAGGHYVASPIAAGDKLIAASRKGTVVVAQIGGKKFEVLARNDFDEEILATPAIAGNTIYLRTAGHLYAIGE